MITRRILHLCTALGLAAASAAIGQVPPQPHAPGIESKDYVWNQPDVQMAAAIAHKGDAAKGKAAYRVCQGCHREDASGLSSADYPQLAGQHPTVLIKQMIDVRTGRRDNPKMHPFVAESLLSPEEVADIAAYLSGLPIPSTNGKGPGTALARGSAIYAADCTRCHGDEGEGSAADFYPRVAGQHYSYLLNEVTMIRDGARRNANPRMVDVVKKYRNDDLEAVSDYMSRLPPPAAPGK